MSAVHHSARSSVLVRAVLLVALVLVLGIVAATSAAPAPTSRQLDAEAVARAGLTLSWTSDAAGGSRLAISRDRLLAVSADGSAVAAASGPAGTGADLVMARSDGSQIRLTALDPLGATFSPNGATVWVVSLAGALSRLDTVTGADALVAAGPFATGMVAANDGSLLAIGLDSVEAPTHSSLVRLASDGTLQELLPAVRIVYRVFSLDTGEVWALVHQPGKPPALIDIADGLPVTSLAVGLDLDVSPDGRHLVWTDAGQVLVASVAGGQPARSVGLGSSPRFAPTGLTVLVRRAASAAVLGIDGELITDLTAGACWAGDGECDA